MMLRGTDRGSRRVQSVAASGGSRHVGLPGAIMQPEHGFGDQGGRQAPTPGHAPVRTQLATRGATVGRFEVLAARPVAGYLDVDVEVECSSAPRWALARDLAAGDALGVRI